LGLESLKSKYQEELQSRDLQDFLGLPSKTLEGYPSLITAILDDTKEDNPDFQNMKESHKQIMDVIDSIQSTEQNSSSFVLQQNTSIDSSALNVSVTWEDEPSSAYQVSVDTLSQIITIFCEYSVLIKKFGLQFLGTIYVSQHYRSFSVKACEYQKVDLNGLREEEKASFWINTYNIVVLHGLIEFRMPLNLINKTEFLSNCKYQIGNEIFGVTEIEHAILRDAMTKPLELNESLVPKYNKSDSKYKYAMTTVQPLLTFALGLGTFSSPKIRIYSVENFQSDLKTNTTSFLSQHTSVSQVQGTWEITLPKLVYWFSKDFANTPKDLLLMLADLVSSDIKKQLEGVIALDLPYNISYNDYDWKFEYPIVQ